MPSQAFRPSSRYDPVSMAAASAVLKVIHEEHVLEHTKETGEHLLTALKEDQAKHPESVGDVRGAGLFIGFELVEDPEKKTPDTKKALALIERHILKRNGVPEDKAVHENWAEFLNYGGSENG